MEASEMVWYAGLLHKLKPYWITPQVFSLISSFLSKGATNGFGWKSSRFVKAQFLLLLFSCYTLMIFLVMLSLIDCMFLSASLAKWLSVRLRTKWLWVEVPLQLSLILPSRLIQILVMLIILSTMYMIKLPADFDTRIWPLRHCEFKQEVIC